jgi:hypothetical protein
VPQSSRLDVPQFDPAGVACAAGDRQRSRVRGKPRRVNDVGLSREHARRSPGLRLSPRYRTNAEANEESGQRIPEVP